MPRPHSSRAKFVWTDKDIALVLPQQPQTVISEELHTILWSLEHVSNKGGFAEVLPNVADYLTDHPEDQSLVDAAVQRTERRVEHST